MFGWKRRNDVLIAELLERIIRKIDSNKRELVNQMGVVATTLNEINTQLVKAGVEITDKIDELLARETLDDVDRAALEHVKATAQALDDIVPDAVTEPLPDPVDPGELDPTDPEVIDPDAPVETISE